MNPFPLPRPAAFTQVLQQLMLPNAVTPGDILDSGDARHTDSRVAESGQLASSEVVGLLALGAGDVDVGTDGTDVDEA